MLKKKLLYEKNLFRDEGHSLPKCTLLGLFAQPLFSPVKKQITLMMGKRLRTLVLKYNYLNTVLVKDYLINLLIKKHRL